MPPLLREFPFLTAEKIGCPPFFLRILAALSLYGKLAADWTIESPGMGGGGCCDSYPLSKDENS